MRNNTFGRFMIATTLAAGVAVWSGSVMRAAPPAPDTVEDVIKAGHEGGIELTRLLGDLSQQVSRADATAKGKLNARIAALRKIRPVIARLEHDRAFARQVYDLSQKNDKAGLGALWGRELGLPVEVRDVRDFLLFASFSVGDYTVGVCVSSVKVCGNTGSSLSVEVVK